MAQSGYNQLVWDENTLAWTMMQQPLVSTDILTTTSGKTLKSARFSLSSTGTVVSAVASKKIKVYAVKLGTSAAIAVNFRSGAATLLEDPVTYGINGGYAESLDPPNFLFATTAGQSLDLVIAGIGTASGRVSYFDDDAS